MKISTIYLSTNDEIISIRDKLGNCGTPRALLIWQNSEAPVLRELELKVLLRYAKNLGIQLGAVCPNPDMKSVLREMGMVVFDSIKDSQQRNWRRTRASFKRPVPIHKQSNGIDYPNRTDSAKTVPTVGYFATILASLAFLIVIAEFIPTASVYITPQPEMRSVDFTLLSSETVKSVSVNGWVPMIIKSDEFQVVSELPSTGSIKIPQGKAVGFANFLNLTASAIDIPDGTMLINSSGKNYKINTSIHILPGGSQITRISAVEAGSEYNTVKGETLTMIGKFGESVKVDIQDAILGGSDQALIAPSNADYVQLKNMALASISKQVLIKIDSLRTANEIYVPRSLTFGNTVSEVYTPKNGEPGKTLSLKLNIVYRAAFIDRSDVLYIANSLIGIDLPAGWVTRLAASEVTFAGDPIVNDKGVVSWPVKVQIETIPGIDVEKVKLSLAGVKINQVDEKLLASLPNASIHVSVFPSWLDFMPIYPYQIKVINGNPNTNISN